MHHPKPHHLEGQLVLKNYRILSKIGTGAFGEIYKAQHEQNSGHYYAIKTEPITTRHPQLQFEAKLYKYLHGEEQQQVQGIPQVHSSGVENGYTLMVMDLLDRSLEDVFVARGKRFSLKTVVMVGLQTLDRLEYLHSRGFLHRDLKPDNLMLGTGDNSAVVFLIDMGLSKKYMSKQRGHIPYREGKQLTGTARYASIGTHKGFQQSRRDDLQSLGYILMYFLRGVLPWQNMKATTAKVKYDLIKNKKISTPLDVLCKGYPSQFASLISYARELKFEEKPDYDLLRGLLRTAAEKSELELDGKYDW